MTTPATSAAATDHLHIFELEITLLHIRPKIWRRVQVCESTTLAELHRIIQCIMGWGDAHCHKFDFPRRATMAYDDDDYGEDYDDLFDFSLEATARQEAKQILSHIVTGEKFRFGYTYDFGDNWDHGILVTKILPRGAQVHATYPICVVGGNACPPEDSGGVSRYQRAPNFDPQHFDLAAVNAKLTALYE
jgi:Plasmid pRiA4b ORF-3-like protein